MRVFVRLLRYVKRTITRAPVRSGLTIVGTALALALFAFVWMLEAGVDRLAEEADQPLLVVFQSSRFCPLTSELPLRYVDDIQAMDGVEDVLPTLIYINACRANLDLVTLHGVPQDDLGAFHALDFAEGGVQDFQREGRGALIGARLAERRGLKLGDRVQLTNVDVRVDGVFTSETAGLDNVAFVRLDQLQNARKKRGLATQLFVKLSPDADGEALARRIDERFADERQTTDTKTMQAFVQGAVGEVGEVVDFARILGLIAVAVVVLVLGNTVFISAQTRRRELGVMETLGVPPATLASLVFVESIGLSLLGGVVGVGAMAGWLHFDPQTIGFEGWGIDIAPDASLGMAALAVALGVGFLAAIGPAWSTWRRPLAVAIKED